MALLVAADSVIARRPSVLIASAGFIIAMRNLQKERTAEVARKDTVEVSLFREALKALKDKRPRLVAKLAREMGICVLLHGGFSC